MPPPPPISDAEWEVMNACWSAAPRPLAANEVVEALAGRRPPWNPKTVKTLLNRLVKKGALTFDTEGNRYLYRPAVRREQCVRSETRSFVDRVFGGAVGPMLVHFVSQSKLSPAEIEQLKRLLEQKAAPRNRTNTQDKE